MLGKFHFVCLQCGKLENSGMGDFSGGLFVKLGILEYSPRMKIEFPVLLSEFDHAIILERM
jgi:hypothetical protein